MLLLLIVYGFIGVRPFGSLVLESLVRLYFKIVYEVLNVTWFI